MDVGHEVSRHALPDDNVIWQCLHCRGPLASVEFGFQCARCGELYPILAGIPHLIREPASYFRAERASLVQAARDARQRMDLLAEVEPYVGLPDITLERHRDVLSAEAAQAETLLALLEPSASASGKLIGDVGDPDVRRPGWSFDTLVSYLLRDWTDTSELRDTCGRIRAALKKAFPRPSGKSVAFAGCGAGGLLAEVATDFARVLGFDLTLPILAAARQLLDGKTLDLALPRILNRSGRISLRRRDPRAANCYVELVAMDALDSAFADCSIDCIVTAFLTDILPDPRALAREVHRVLPQNGVWINYGPSGNNLKALWRFDQQEAEAFFATAGFTVVHAEAQRGTNLDITGVCPPASFRNTMCYTSIVRKTGEAEPTQAVTTALPAKLWDIVPQHFPGARLVHPLVADEGGGLILQHDRIAERPEHWELGGRAARMMVLVDGMRTVGEISKLLHQRNPPQSLDETHRAFARFFEQGLLRWSDRNT